MFKNALEQFISNRPPKHVVTSTNSIKIVVMFAISAVFICGFEQVFACKETSYVEVSDLCK